MWYETALQHMGFEKNLDLNISLIPHTDKPDKTLADIRFALDNMGHSPNGR
jgi:hypothetical protein